MLNILHLTDLHYRKSKKYDQGVLLRALLEDISRQTGEVGSPDLIVFSGDLVHDADEDRVYDSLYDNFIEDLLKVSNCSLSSFVCAPGNHDIERSKVKGNLALHNEILKRAKCRSSLNEVYEEGLIKELSLEKRGKYTDFHEFFDVETVIWSDGFNYVLDRPEKNTSILAIDTAWAGFGGLEGVSDERKLLVPEAAIQTALQSIPEGRFVVLVHHHPLGWLSEFCETDLRDSISKKVDIQLFGHVHVPRPIVEVEESASRIVNQSGALYTWRGDIHLGYTFLRCGLGERHTELRWRTYYDKRKAFDSATNLSDSGGVIYSTPEAKRYFSKVLDGAKLAEIDEWRRTTLSECYGEEFKTGVLDRPIDETFVAPPLRINKFSKDNLSDSEHFEEKDLGFEELLRSGKNYTIEGMPEYGRTTLLQQICCRLSSDTVDSLEQVRVPILINYSSITRGTKRIQAALRKALPEGVPAASLDDLLAEGRVTILIDDVNADDMMRLAELKSFMSEFKENRFILSQPQRSESVSLRRDLDLPVYLEQVRLHPFKRSDVRKMVRKWDDSKNGEEELLNRVVNELRGMNVPQTPFNSALLLDIYSSDSSFSPLNRASLIERFIETLLKKRAISEVLRKSFDFKNREHYLSYVAEHMCRQDRYILSHADLYKLTDEYLSNLGLPFSAHDILQDTIECRVFAHNRLDDTVRFRFRAFLEYFCASQMRRSVDFYDWVTDERRYLSYINELEYFAGLERDKKALLEVVEARHTLLSDEIFGESFRPLLDKMDHHYSSLDSSGSSEYADEMAAALNDAPLTAAERDELLDAEIPRDAEGRQEVYRPNVTTSPERFLLSIFLYSRLLKNTELIGDVEKRLHLGKIVESWAFLVAGSFVHIPSLVKHRRMTVNGISYEIRFPREFSDEKVARLISTHLPKEIGRVMFRMLGTEKLARQLREVSLPESSDAALIRFLKSALYMDLRLHEWWHVPRKFASEMKHSEYYQEVMLTKSLEVYRVGLADQQVETRLQKEVAEIFANLYGEDKVDVEKKKNSKRVQLERMRLISKLKGDE